MRRRNLIRIVKPDGSVYERVIELRQNETIDLADIPDGGNYTWYVYPLDWNFVQIGCLEGGPWRSPKTRCRRRPKRRRPGVGLISLVCPGAVDLGQRRFQVEPLR